jgi:hypothetical protein
MPVSDSNIKWHKTAFTNPLMSSDTIAEKTKKYRSLLDNKDANGLNLQARLVVEASIVKEKLIRAFGPCVTILTPPDNLTNQIFSNTGGDPFLGEGEPRPLNGEKSWMGSEVKVIKEYEGDWDDAKDLARCTLVVETPEQHKLGWRIVLGHFFGQLHTPPGPHAFRLHSFKEKKRDDPRNPCGYTDYTVFVQSGGFIAEIQFNRVPMMYAKSKNEFIAGFGEDRAREMGTKYNLVPGFLGHELYEIHRVQKYKDKATANKAALASKAYYDYFRSDPADYGKGVLAKRLCEEVGVIRTIAGPKAPKRYDKYASSLDELLGPEPPDGRERAIDLQPGNFKQLFGTEWSQDLPQLQATRPRR